MNNKENWTTWYTSDIHFGHENVIGFCDRPFIDKEEMKEKIIENWNKLVNPGDLCIFVGDIFFYHTAEEMKNTLSRMNGRKVLVKGNHDLTPRKMMNAGFEICVEEMVMTISGERVIISHYPFKMDKKLMFYLKIKSFFKKMIGLRALKFEKYHDRRPEDKGQFLIHGHTHSKEKSKDRMIHVGMDAWEYKPVNIQEISNLINQIKAQETRQ